MRRLLNRYGQENHLLASILESLTGEAYCHVPKEFRDKLSPKSKKCIFLGYGKSVKMGYRLWDPKAKKIVCSNDVYFNEEKMHKKHVPTVDIRRVIFQEDGHVYDRA